MLFREFKDAILEASEAFNKECHRTARKKLPIRIGSYLMETKTGNPTCYTAYFSRWHGNGMKHFSGVIVKYICIFDRFIGMTVKGDYMTGCHKNVKSVIDELFTKEMPKTMATTEKKPDFKHRLPKGSRMSIVCEAVNSCGKILKTAETKSKLLAAMRESGFDEDDFEVLWFVSDMIDNGIILYNGMGFGNTRKEAIVDFWNDYYRSQNTK